MQRVAIIGCSGSGKSTLARELGRVTGLPVVHLDALFWQPGWTEPDREWFHNRVSRIAHGDSWIIDGNDRRTLPERIELADTAIFLDIPRRLSIWRITRRVIENYGTTRPDMAEGCNERFDPGFFWWAWHWHSRVRNAHYRLLEDKMIQHRIIVLRSPAAVSLYLRLVEAGYRVAS